MARYMSGKDCVVLQGGTTNVKPVSEFALKEELESQVAPALKITGVDNEDGTGKVTIQAQDVNGNDLAGRFLFRVWRGASAYADSTAITDFDVDTGAILETVTANADFEVITDDAGKVVMDVEDAAEHHIMATAGGPIYAFEITVTN